MNYEFHEVSNMFPMMSPEEYADLKKDISKNGLIESIWLHNNKIIDGRNRYNACLELDIPPQFRQWNKEGSLVAFVISLNLVRRNLTSSQKATVSVQSLPLIEAEAKERQRQAGIDYGRGKKKVNQKVDKPIESVKQSLEIAAELTGTNREYVSKAKQILKQDPELFKQIQDGKISVKQAKLNLEAKNKELKNKKGELKKSQIYESVPNKSICTEALQFSTIAISQLSRIRKDDPKRTEALNEVKDYIEKELKK